MADFGLVIDQVLDSEGGYVNDPDDPGGETNFGIAKRFHRDVDIKKLDREGAKKIYWGLWEAGNFGLIEDQTLAGKAFDSSVCLGPRRANKMLQRAANASMRDEVLEVDGMVGKKTLAAINGLPAGEMVCSLRAQIAYFRERRIAQEPTQAKFKGGWIARAYE